jgi:hypothetical protein
MKPFKIAGTPDSNTNPGTPERTPSASPPQVWEKAMTSGDSLDEVSRAAMTPDRDGVLSYPLPVAVPSPMKLNK